ncbi:MAG: shikimate kinase, partial [Planctomycetota bacterium]
STPPDRRSIRILALIGLRAVGKTSLGRALADRLAWDFADGDDLIAREVGEPAGDYLSRAGETEFRRLEERLALDLLGRPGPLVFSLGGGAVESAATRQALKAADIYVIHLSAPLQCLVDRLRESPVNRPSLTGCAPEEEIRLLRLRRLPMYQQLADFELETFPANVDACCERIIAKIH